MSEAREINIGACVSGGVDVFKANLVPSLITSVMMMFIPVLGWIVLVNYMTAVRQFRADGTPIDNGALFNFDHAVDKIVGVLIFALVSSFFITTPLVLMMIPAIAALPGDTPFVKALTGSAKWSLENIGPSIILWLAFMAINLVGMILCCVGLFATVPISWAALQIAYEDAEPSLRPMIEAA